jgi:hypothetical protein
VGPCRRNPTKKGNNVTKNLKLKPTPQGKAELQGQQRDTERQRQRERDRDRERDRERDGGRVGVERVRGNGIEDKLVGIWRLATG